MAKISSQVNALLRKNAVYQRRNWLANCCLVVAPIFIVVILVLIQALVNQQLSGTDNKCGCKCLVCTKEVETCTLDASGVQQCKTVNENLADPFCQPGAYDKCQKYDKTQCGLEFSEAGQAVFCATPHPSIFPAFQMVPPLEDRATVPPAVKGAADSPLPLLFTGKDAVLSQGLVENMYPPAKPLLGNAVAGAVAGLGSDISQGINLGQIVNAAGLTLGTDQYDTESLSYIIDPALIGEQTYALTSDCSAFGDAANLDFGFVRTNLSCAQLVPSPQPDAAAINEQLYCGWKDARCEGVRETNGYVSPVDFRDTSTSIFSLTYWTNYTLGVETQSPSALMRSNQVLGLAFASYLKWMTGAAEGGLPRRTSALIGIADFPKAGRKLTLDFSSLIGPLFYTWVLMILLPVMIVQLVYEKQHNLQSMMKMHGLSNVTYWLVMYSWYFLLHVVFIALLVIFGSIVNLKFFRLNDYGVQIVFYLLFINMQIALACLASTLYNNARTAVVTSCLYVFGSGLVANLLISTFYESNKSFNTALYLFPAFGLYRGMWEFGEYAFRAAYLNATAMTFSNFNDHDNDMWQVMLIFALEGPLFLLMAWYLNVVLPGNGIHKHWLFCLKSRKSHGKAYAGAPKNGDVQMAKASRDGAAHGNGASSSGGLMPSAPGFSDVADGHEGNKQVSVRMARAADDVMREEQNAAAANPQQDPIVLRNIRKVYPARDGQPEKVAVDDMSLVVRKGECFGMLGPNGAGKSTCINILVGLLEASSGEAYVGGMDLSEASTEIWKHMGVCPQDNILWDNLTAREHLLFYGRLKGLTGDELKRAVDEALAAVQLTSASQKRSKTYSGGMKRRLSVAISLIGSPQVCYLDEPSTGLDPASRQALWAAVKAAKKDRAIILTTHSMQEAEMLCDRLGIVVNGRLVCIGNPRELTSRHGNYLELSIAVPPEQVVRADALVHELSPGAVQTYSLAGALRYDLPTAEVNIHNVFTAVQEAKRTGRLDVKDWGLANATLEEVFIKVARQAGATATD